MNQTNSNGSKHITVHHPRFAAMYNRLSRGKVERSVMDPLREEVVGKAHGIVLEVGAGNGLNFAYYQPERIERVEAVEPDAAMITYAQESVQTSKVPITITQAPAEALPFVDNLFDSVVVTLVFCSVVDQARGLTEIKRVLKPGGTLLMVEHIRSHRPLAAWLQDILVPLTMRTLGNCHWNRDTAESVRRAGFEISEKRDLGGWLLPMIVLEAYRT